MGGSSEVGRASEEGDGRETGGVQAGAEGRVGRGAILKLKNTEKQKQAFVVCMSWFFIFIFYW